MCIIVFVKPSLNLDFKHFYNFLCVVFLLVVSFQATANHTSVFLSPSFNQKLSQNSINAVVQDPYGFIWIATKDGLNRFDGNEVVTYQFKKNSKESLSDNNIRTLSLSSDSQLLVGMLNGAIDRIDLKTGNISTLTIHDWGEVRKLMFDNKGQLWVVARKGVFFYEQLSSVPTEFSKKYGYLQLFSYGDIVSVFQSKEGTYYFGSETIGVLAWRPGSDPTPIKFSNAEIHSGLRRIVQTTDGRIFFAGRRHLSYIKHGELLAKEYPLEMDFDKHGEIRSLFVDNETLWIGFLRNGIGKITLKDNKFELIVSDDSPNSKTIVTSSVFIFKDKSGLLWIGTDGYGVKICNPENPFGIISKKTNSNNGITFSSVRVVKQDPYNPDLLWIGGYHGLNIYHKKLGLIRSYDYSRNNAPGITNNVIYAIEWVSKDTIILGSEGGGVFLLLPEKNIVKRIKGGLHDPSGLSSSYIMSIHKSANGSYWIGTTNGINKLNLKTMTATAYLYDSSLKKSLEITDIKEDNKDFLWLATNKGLYHFDVKTGNAQLFKVSNKSTFYNRIRITALLKDGNRLWLATEKEGALLVQPNINNGSLEIIKELNEEMGVANTMINGLIKDTRNCLWLSTNKGLTCYNLSNNSCRNFNVNDGLQDNEFNRFAYCTGSNGELYFGGINGITWFNPEDIKPRKYFPKVVFTDFKLFNERIHFEKDLNNNPDILLSPTQNYFTVRFSATDFQSPENLSYSFKLVGLHTAWNDLNNSRTVSFSNLEPGNYTLRVRVAYTDQKDVFSESFLRIYIEPPVWKTLWFKTFAIIAIIGLVYLIVMWRTAAIEKQRKRLSQEVEERTKDLLKLNQDLKNANSKVKEAMNLKSEFMAMLTHDIKAPLNQIQGIVQLLRLNRSDEERNRLLDYITQSNNNLGQIIQNLLDYAKFESGNIDIRWEYVNLREVLPRILNGFAVTAKQKNIDLTWVVEQNVPEMFLTDDLRLSQVVSNIVSNALKFTDKGTIQIHLFAESLNGKKAVKFMIKDSGIGIPKDKQELVFEKFAQADKDTVKVYGGSGLGLAICKLLVSKMGGIITLESEPGVGTTIYFVLPVLQPEDIGNNPN